MGIRSKLIVALLCLGAFLCCALYYLMQWSFDRGMIDYVNQQERDSLQQLVDLLEDYYRENRGWEELRLNPRRYHQLARTALPQDRSGQGQRRFDQEPRSPNDPRRLEPRRPRPVDTGRSPRRRNQRQSPPPPTLLDADRNAIVGRYSPEDLTVAISPDGKVVGWVAVKPPRYPVENSNLSIGNNLDIAFALVGLVLLISVFFIGIPLARHFVQPLTLLTRATSSLTRGNYQTDYKLQRTDEIGQLANNLRILATTLSKNETSRSRWIADISHELRTPLAIISGEIEAMVEEIRPITHDNLVSLKQEIDQLSRLVNDLHELSNAEIGALRYNKTVIDITRVVSNGVQRFEELISQKPLQLKLVLPDRPLWVSADVQRLDQLLNNLMTNEIKYADPGGTLQITVSEKNQVVTVAIEDSGPGVKQAELGKLFDHLYRVSSSRNRKTGGSGLGLAICKNIAEAHQGTISAMHSPLGGLRINLCLPLGGPANR